MTEASATKGAVSIRAYRGDAKTLLAFNLTKPAARLSLAGFTVQTTPPGVSGYYLFNTLQFERPGDHAQDPTEPAYSSINAPFHKFRWLHVPGSAHQGLDPVWGEYHYTVTPRYFDERKSLLPLDPTLSVSVQIEVAPFVKGDLAVAFTRGFTQSQAFVRHFGLDAVIKPKGADLTFDTSAISGRNAKGEAYTFEQQYGWLGFTARDRIFDILRRVQADKTLRLDLFAYDLNEPDFVKAMIAIGKRARVILDDAALHHDKTKPKPEDRFETLFAAKAPGRIKRGHFGRYAHDKVLVVYRGEEPIEVLTGSTNYSVTGLYVNSNHVLVYRDPKVAALYAVLFQQVWNDGASGASTFAKSSLATKIHSFKNARTPDTRITFSPHDDANARSVLGGLVERVRAESTATGRTGNVLFAVMQLDGGKDNPVYDALNTLHADPGVFSYGVSDTPAGIKLYPIGSKTGVLVTGKPIRTQLPQPFSQVPNVGLGHQIHHKFVVCGFNSPEAVVYCGSSNLALAGEKVNGDNLLEIRDRDVATVFAIEALGLVDHFDFLDSRAQGAGSASLSANAAPPAVKDQAAVSARWFLGVTDFWVKKYFDPKDLHCIDRELFAG